MVLTSPNKGGLSAKLRHRPFSEPNVVRVFDCLNTTGGTAAWREIMASERPAFAFVNCAFTVQEKRGKGETGTQPRKLVTDVFASIPAGVVLGGHGA